MQDLATVVSAVADLSSSAMFAIVLWRAIHAVETILIAVYDDDSKRGGGASSQVDSPKD